MSVNVNNKNIAISLTTESAITTDSTRAFTTWNIPIPLGVSDPTEGYNVSVNSMTFDNVFQNITPVNNTLKVLTVFKNNATNVEQEDLMVIQIDPGHYDINSLLNELNQKCSRIVPSYQPSGDPDLINIYGIGGMGPGFVTKNEKCVMLCPTNLGIIQQSYTQATTTHHYIGFYIVQDDSTAALLDILGFSAQYVGMQIESPSMLYSGYGFTYGADFTSVDSVLGTEPVVTYSTIVSYNNYGTPIGGQLISDGAYDVSGVKMLILESNQLQGAFTCVSDGTSALCAIPITKGFGERIVYQPPNPIKVLVQNRTFTSIDISIFDENGNTLDFQGCQYSLVLLFEHVGVETNYDNSATSGGINPQASLNTSSLSTQQFNNFKKRAVNIY